MSDAKETQRTSEMGTSQQRAALNRRVRMPCSRLCGHRARLRAPLLLAFAGSCLVLAGCDAFSEQGPPNFSGDPKRGMALIKHYGCGGCHLIPQIADAKGNVGPPLLHVGTRTYLAGFISNSPENMALWIQNPQKALPGNAMPQMGVTPQESRDIAAFLYTLR
jgi:cytochrome c